MERIGGMIGAGDIWGLIKRDISGPIICGNYLSIDGSPDCCG